MSTPGGLDPRRLDARGAVDLGALAAAREAQQRAEAQARAAREAAGGEQAAAEGVYPGAYVVAVDEASFQAEVIDRSFLVPVVVDFWAEWCGPCKQLSPLLERLVEADGGRWVLATVDVDANQRLAQAFQVQSIPTVYAVVKGQPIPLFQGAQPEQQVRGVLDQLLQVAAQNGVTGRVDGSGAAAPAASDPAAPPQSPELDEAAEAIERGDLSAAKAAYQRLLDRSPSDPDGRAGLALVTLLDRTAGVADPAAAVAAAEQDPSDVAAACTAADVLVLNRQVERGLNLLVETVRRTSGEERDRAREHLVGLFDVLGDGEPAVGPARRALAAALF